MTLVGCDLHSGSNYVSCKRDILASRTSGWRLASTATASGNPRAAQRTESMAAVRHKRLSIACQHPPA